MYEYHARIVAVHDADTVTVDVDLGVSVHVTLKLRFHGLNAPELATPAGQVALAFVKDWLEKNAPDGQVVIQTFKDRQEKYGRYLAEVDSLPAVGEVSGANLNNALIASGNAVVYMANR